MLLDEAWRTLGLEPTKDRRLVRAAFVSAVRLSHPDRNPLPDAHERTAALITAYHVAEQALRKDEATAARLRRQSERATARPGTRANGRTERTTPHRTRSGASSAANGSANGSAGRATNGSARPGGAEAPRVNGTAAAAPAGDPTGAPAPHPTPPAPPPVVQRISDDTVGLEAPTDEAFAFLRERLPRLGHVSLADPSAGMFQLVVQFLESPVCYLTFDLQGRAATGSTEVFLTIESIEARPAPDLGAVTQLVVEILS